MSSGPFDALLPVDPGLPDLPDLDAAEPLVDPGEFGRRALARRVSDEAAWVLAASMVPEPLTPGQVLLRRGDQADALFLLCAGELEVALDALVLGRVEPGRWLGEVNLIDGGPVSATVTAVAPGLVLRLSRDRFDQVREQDPAVAAELLHAMLVDLAERIRRCSAGTVAPTGAGFSIDPADRVAAEVFADLTREVA